ncbi:MAG: alpha-amylase family glycosyl hydrolase [Candidatus Cohnella colombiensis]|uniref:Alpha-amylase family glycosyl hydrolase n=1 Tax=Candidatus Cohnella colombiensis TaxID=3121368 RepID=A0AA95EYL2_9BACL|nr:MAG: alpha-amylase family glycosyl hydrolase [Cohnella sp.]
MSKLRLLPVIVVVMILWLSACSSAPPAETTASQIATSSPQSSPSPQEAIGPSNVYYEIFVRSFADSNGDGIGDLNGITRQLDYLQSLGIEGIWLTPIQPSPSYHGYDVSDYYGINPDFGTLDDFKTLITEAHNRDIRIIMDLVINHTSTEHPWFIDSAQGKDSPYRDWYTWASHREKGATPTDGATGQEPWHPKGDDKYLGIFWSGMPDLNFDNADVRSEMIKIGQYWLKFGVDGFRLDAAKHIFGDFKSTIASKTVQNKNQVWWQEFRHGLNEVNPEAYLVGEVWDGAAVIAPYLDNALDSAFNFDLAGTLLSTASSEKATSIAFTLSRVHEFFGKSSNGQFIDAPFLSNHDQTRVMSAVKGNVNHAKTAAALLLTMPGKAFIYYGEELGMSGIKPDERLREPFPWSRDGGSIMETTWEPSMYRGDGEVSVQAEDESPDSLLNRYRQLISWRKQEVALRSGKIATYDSDNGSVLTYIRSADEQQLLVAHNLSGTSQSLTLSETDAQPIAFTKVALTTDNGAQLSEHILQLPPYTTAILKP